MKLVLLGNPRQSYSWKNHIEEDAKQLGWEVNHLYPRNMSAKRIAQICKGADIFLWAYTHGLDIQGDVEDMLKTISRYNCTTISLHLDLYRGIPKRELSVGRHPFWKADYVFTADGGGQEFFERRKVNHYWLQPAVVASGVYIGNVTNEFRHDIVFTGSCNVTAHRNHRAKMLAWAQNRYGNRFGWYGGNKKAKYRNVRANELNDLFASSKVVLGDVACPGKVQFDYYWSDRLPITLGRGGVLVHPHVKGLTENGFIDNETLMLFEQGNLVELETIIEQLLEDKDKREALRATAMATIRQNHTWQHRLKYVERIINES